MAALWEAAGYKWRYRGWRRPGHTTVEVHYGGRWHYLDTFLKFYTWTPDPQSPGGRTIASQEDNGVNGQFVRHSLTYNDCSVRANRRRETIGQRRQWSYCQRGLHTTLSDAEIGDGWGSVQRPLGEPDVG